MNHLKILKYLDYFSVVTLFLAGGLTVASILGSVGLVIMAEPAAAMALAPSLAITGVTVAVIVAMAWFAFVAGRGIEHGRGRVAQSLLAVASLGSLPFGTAFGIYALWVCWYNEDTKSTFDDSNVRGEVIRTAIGVAVLAMPIVPITLLSIAALMPTNLATLDAEFKPIADLEQRRIPDEGCGLNERTTGGGCERITAGFKTEEIRFPTRGEVMGFTGLNGTLYVPEGLEGRRPAVILVHGSGPQDRHERSPGELVGAYANPIPIFDDLAEILAAQGLVVLTYDKRACGKCYREEHTGADYSDFRFSLFMDDALDGVDFLASHPAVDPGRVVVIGHSQGGGFAPHIAAADDRIVAAVMLAGFTGTFRDAMIDQLERVADIRAGQWDWFGAWSVQLQSRVYATCLNKLDGDYDPDEQCLGGGVSLQSLAEYDELNRRTPATLGALDKPVFAISGTVDRNIPPEEMALIKAGIAGGDAEFHLIAGMGHGLTDMLEPADPPVLHPELVERLTTFLSTLR